MSVHAEIKIIFNINNRFTCTINFISPSDNFNIVGKIIITAVFSCLHKFFGIINSSVCNLAVFPIRTECTSGLISTYGMRVVRGQPRIYSVPLSCLYIRTDCESHTYTKKHSQKLPILNSPASCFF